MKFGKTYQTLLPSFPEEWRERAIHYGQLKKLINSVVDELSGLGLNPDVLAQLLQPDDSPPSDAPGQAFQLAAEHGPIPYPGSHASYELKTEKGAIVPRLHFWVDEHGQPPLSIDSPHTSTSSEDPLDRPSADGIGSDSTHSLPVLMTSSSNLTSQPHVNVLYALQRHHASVSSTSHEHDTHIQATSDDTLTSLEDAISSFQFDNELDTHPQINDSTTSHREEIIIPLTSDTAFYQLLTSALASLSEHQRSMQAEFASTISQLAADISRVSYPSSKGHSDLYAWRRIFQLWVQMQIFESSAEKDRGELEVEEVEKRLGIFAQQVIQQGYGDPRALKRKETKALLDRFLKVNVLLLDLKKFQHFNAEAARKILKKHQKRTALQIPPEQQNIILPMLASLSLQLSSSSSSSSSQQMVTLPHMLVVQMTEALLPVIPSIEDYECLICTSIAYIPIRLPCCRNPIFCVRCLVKLQKSGVAECPLCRSPTVLTANRSNVDLALKRFMKDWFPIETREKAKANQREAAEEEMREMGFAVPQSEGCCVM